MENTGLALVTDATDNMEKAIVRLLITENRKVRGLQRNIEHAKTVLPADKLELA